MAQEFIQLIRYNKLQLKYFTLKEFDSPDEPGSGSKMDKKFLEKLDYARHNAGVPFKINSGYRSKKWNLKVGGRVGSSHTGDVGLAADIHCVGSRNRALIIKALLDVGINRIGIAKTFIHCDVDKQKDQDVFWLYD
jgi:zinc D-Ala-D-Ala carboxypeptidase